MGLYDVGCAVPGAVVPASIARRHLDVLSPLGIYFKAVGIKRPLRIMARSLYPCQKRPFCTAAHGNVGFRPDSVTSEKQVTVVWLAVSSALSSSPLALRRRLCSARRCGARQQCPSAPRRLVPAGHLFQGSRYKTAATHHGSFSVPLPAATILYRCPWQRRISPWQRDVGKTSGEEESA